MAMEDYPEATRERDVPSKRQDIHDANASLSNAIDTLGEQISSLEQALHPVLRQVDAPALGLSLLKGDDWSPQQEFVHNARDNVVYNINRIANILGRLDFS